MISHRVYMHNKSVERTIFSITSLRHIASNPILRTSSYLACLINVVGLVTSLTIRLRLRSLRQDTSGRKERFAQVLVTIGLSSDVTNALQAVRCSWSEQTMLRI